MDTKKQSFPDLQILKNIYLLIENRINYQELKKDQQVSMSIDPINT